MNLGVKVPAMSRKAIEEVATEVRAALGMEQGGLKMWKLVELVFPQVIEGFDWDVVSDSDLDGDEARTHPDENLILLSQSTYDAAVELNGRANFTLAHEVGHFFLHRGISPSFSRDKIRPSDKRYLDSEWQADTFAAAFLMPELDIKATCSSSLDVVGKYYVSYEAAGYRWKNIMKNKGGQLALAAFGNQKI